MKKISVILIVTAACLSGLPAQASPEVDKLLQKYQQQGAAVAVPEQGKNLWYSKNGDRGCINCHGSTPADTGRHVRTNKAIKPMAASVNPERYQDSKKVEKWFLRNCKWTLGRLCTAQEKANTLDWLNSL
ncbi:MAG: DUF1924 domain-containing protein [Pseudomonadales bacterium]|nr:DUF1924 domain-containing protein [Pseudomonadales bacterium]